MGIRLIIPAMNHCSASMASLVASEPQQNWMAASNVGEVLKHHALACGCFLARLLLALSSCLFISFSIEKLYVSTESEQLEVVEAAKQPLTLRPSIDFPAAVTAIYLVEDRSGWLTAHGHTIAGHAHSYSRSCSFLSASRITKGTNMQTNLC